MTNRRTLAVRSSAAMMALAAGISLSYADSHIGAIGISGLELAIIDPSIAAFYAESADEIDRLVVIARTGGSADERISALSEIASNYPVVAEVLSRELIGDSETEIALFAVQALQGAVVMMDHGPMEDLASFPALAAAMQSHAQSIGALRPAIMDERDEIRIKAASTLASLGDEKALTLINAAAASGTIRAVEAANYFTLAGTSAANAYLANYLRDGDAGAQETAVGYLAAVPEYQSRIRDGYFLNPDADPSVRLAASKSLGLYDPEFPDYALTVLSGDDLEPAFAGTTIQGYVASIEQRGLLTPEIAENVGGELANYDFSTVVNPDDQADFQALSDRLNALAGEMWSGAK
ncbi:MAG: hypothetical protein OXH76_15065 [Boseongicola sp.]|nr:hypothetical protein [Boseongicola sp.]